MSSFEKRYISFKNFQEKSIPPELFASAFFISETPTSCYCVLCKKNLDGWEASDVPILEHFKRHNDCPLFSLNTTEGRNRTFPASFDQEVKREFIKQGFFFYKIKEKSRFDLFCYRCGFYVNDRTGMIKDHYKTCKKKKRNGNFFINNKHSIFANDLLSGRINLAAYCFKNVYIPTKDHENYKELIEKDECVFDDCGEVLKRKINKILKDSETMVDEEIEKIMTSIDEKFETNIKELKS